MYTDWKTQYSTKAKMVPWKMQGIGNLCGLCFRLIHLISNIDTCLEIPHLLICTALTACKSNSTKSYHDCVVLALTVGDALGEYIYIPANFAWAAGEGSPNCFQCSAALGSLSSMTRSTWIWHACHAMHACLSFQQSSSELCHWRGTSHLCKSVLTEGVPYVSHCECRP